MRKIKLETWKSKVPKYDDEGKIIGATEKDEDLLDALNVLIANKKPEEMPRGLDKFRTFGRLTKAFEKASESRVLELEEADYKFLKDTLDKDVPSIWGMNAHILDAIESFMSAEEE